MHPLVNTVHYVPVQCAFPVHIFSGNGMLKFPRRSPNKSDNIMEAHFSRIDGLLSPDADVNTQRIFE